MMLDATKRLIEEIDKKRNTDPLGKERISRVLEGTSVDYLPLIFWRPRNASIPGKTYNMHQQFYDSALMLHSHLEEIEECCDKSFDAPLCLRPNFGTIMIPAVMGSGYRVFEDAYPWITEHLTKEQLYKYDSDNIKNKDMLKRAKEYLAYFKDSLPEWIHVYLPDTQGPFDIAHLVSGDDIFYKIYDEPDFVHYLMELCTDVYINVTKELKEVIDEPPDSCFHGHALARGIYMRNGGVRISEDSATLLSPDQIDEFVIPYVKKALDAFGGGFIHYCGKNDYLLDCFLAMNGVNAVNLGNPEKYEFTGTMQKFIQNNKCCFGLWPAEENETAEQYIQRMVKASQNGERGLLLHFDESMFAQLSCSEILDIWKKRRVENDDIKPV